MTLRVTLTSLVLLAYTVLLGTFPDFKKYRRSFLLVGLFNCALPYVLIANAVTDLNAGIAAIINATTPLFTAAVAAVWIKEPFGPRRIAGTILGITGVAVLVGVSPLPFSGKIVFAALQALVAAFSYGIASVLSRVRFKDISPMHVSLGQMLGATVLLLPVSLPYMPNKFPPTHALLAVAALAVFSTALAYLIFFRLIVRVGAVQTSTVTFLVPFFSILWGVLFLGEPLSIGLFAGLGTILLSVWLVLSPQRQVPKQETVDAAP
jgi:drug/metabolite transporter (DMT)-like permease